jgi:hypothetical protein
MFLFLQKKMKVDAPFAQTFLQGCYLKKIDSDIAMFMGLHLGPNKQPIILGCWANSAPFSLQNMDHSLQPQTDEP